MPRSRRLSNTIGEIYSSKLHLHTYRNVNPIIIKLLERVSLSLDCWKLSRSLGTWVVWKSVPGLCFSVCSRVGGWRWWWLRGTQHVDFQERDCWLQRHSSKLRSRHIFNCLCFTGIQFVSLSLNSHSAQLSSNRCHPCIMEYLTYILTSSTKLAPGSYYQNVNNL